MRFLLSDESVENYIIIMAAQSCEKLKTSMACFKQMSSTVCELYLNKVVNTFGNHAYLQGDHHV